MEKNVVLFVVLIALGFACKSDLNKDKESLGVDIQYLESFARLYGYARWFHPSDEAQEINWDRFAVLGVQKVENVKSSAALRDTLYALFSPIVQGLQLYEAQKPQPFNPEILLSPDPDTKSVAWQHYGVYLSDRAKLYKSIRTNKSEVGKQNKIFERMPQFGEITKVPIGNNLVCVVPLTLLTNGSATYPQTKATSLDRLQSELSHISFNGGFNQRINLASVIIAWNVLQHFFPYFDEIDTNWDEVLGKALNSTLANKNKTDFFVTLSQMISQIDDGHGIVFNESMQLLPIRAEFIENEIVITSSNDYRLEKGDIIRTMDGKPVMEALDEKEKMISGSPQLRRYRALNVLGGKLHQDNTMNNYIAYNNPGNKSDSNETSLMIERNGKEQHVIVANSRQEGSIFFNPIDERKYLSETIIEVEPGIYYINMSNCTERAFEQKKDILSHAKAVIYDERGSGKLHFFQIIPYLIEQPVSSTWWNISQTIYPDRKDVEFDKSNWDVQPQNPLFKSKSIIINESSVVSSGETAMGIIDHYNLATTVGDSTAGCNGNVNYINLPCGYIVMWTGMKVLKHDGSQLYLKGFEPDYPVNKTIQAIKEGRDEYFEKALEIARQG